MGKFADAKEIGGRGTRSRIGLSIHWDLTRVRAGHTPGKRDLNSQTQGKKSETRNTGYTHRLLPLRGRVWKRTWRTLEICCSPKAATKGDCDPSVLRRDNG